MTDNFLQKLEEKVMILLTELEDKRKEVQQLSQEVSRLRDEQMNHANKLQALISLLDSLETTDEPSHTVELQVIREQEEYATA